MLRESISSHDRVNFLINKTGSQTKSITRIQEGRTNETYLVEADKSRYICRIAGAGTEDYINREYEIFNMKVGEEIGIAPKLYANSGGDFLIEYVDAPVISCEENLLENDVLDKTVNVLKKLHKSRKKLSNTFNMSHNIVIYKETLKKLGAEYPPELLAHEERLIKLTKKLDDKYSSYRVPCHVDNYFGNIMITSHEAVLIDWEYAGMCDRYCDFANLALINDLSEDGEMRFLDAYFKNEKEKPDINKYYLFKMANSFMWTYWHLVKLNQNYQVDYNNRRWRERLNIAVDIMNRYGGLLEE